MRTNATNDRRGLRLRAVVISVLSAVAAGTACAATSSQDEAVYRRYLDFDSLVKGGRIVPNWLPDGSSFWYVQGGPNDRQILKVDPATGATMPFFDVQRLRSALREVLGHEPAGNGVPFERFEFTGPDRVSFSVDGARYELDLTRYAATRPLQPFTYSTVVVRSEAERTVAGSFMQETFNGLGPRLTPEAKSSDGRWFASIEDYNLTLRASVDGQKVQVTRDGTALAFWYVQAVQWNPWSPNNLHLAVFKQHTEGVVRIPTIEWLKPVEQVLEVIGVRAGAKLYRSELYLVDTYSQQPTLIDLGDTTDQYLRPLTWTPDSSELILASYNRVLSRVDIQAVNAATGAVRTVFTEQSKTFLTNHHEAIWGTNTGFTLLPDGAGFIWCSERSGWNHLYYYDMHGKLVRQLTRGAWPVKDVLRVDQAGGWVYFRGHDDQTRPYDTHLYRVGLDGRGFSRLTEGKGQHAVGIAPSAQYFTDTYSTVDVPPRTVLRKADGTLVGTLGEADISPLRQVGWVAPQEHVVKAADGVTDLWATLYFPYNFDPNRKYPVVEYIYGGPQSAKRPLDFLAASNSMAPRYGRFNRALANLGFVVVTIDGRGTPERSKAFHDVVYRNFGRFEIADHAGAIRQLGARLKFLDLDRVGIWGVSWGGQFAFRALTQAADLYKVGICQNPNFDPRRFTLYEPYLGLPRENPTGYEEADALTLAPKLKGEVLLAGGLNDTGMVGDLFQMSDRLIRLGKQHRMMAYPYMGHAISDNGMSEYDLEMKKRFLVEHLMPPGQP